MRHRLTVILLVFALWPSLAMGDGYNTLWKQAETARSKDLPREELAMMKRIAQKAAYEKEYGQLLAAEFRALDVWRNISPDSLLPQLRRLEQKAEEAEKGDGALAAVYMTALSRTYKANRSLPDAEEKANHYARKAMANPTLLAQTQTKAYQPLAQEGIDGHIFKHDLLHLVGFETASYQAMHDHYAAHGNRGAACLAAYYTAKQGRDEGNVATNKSRYLNTIDSLIYVYKDLQEAGELAIEHYYVIAQVPETTAEEKVNYINYALNRWGKWPRMNILRNEKCELLNPMFRLARIRQVYRPSEKINIVVDEARNIRELTMTVNRLNITADNNYDPDNEADYAQLRKLTSPVGQVSKTLHFLGQPEYKVLKDSFALPPLSIGAYLVEVKCDNKDVDVARRIVYVSDIAYIQQDLPGKGMRFVTVNATTGQPIAGAKVIMGDINTRTGKINRKVTLTTDNNGEATYTYINNTRARDMRYVYAYTDKDTYTPPAWSSNHFASGGKDTKRTQERIFTDRSIYRPGQTVHVAVLRYEQSEYVNTRTLEGEKVTLTLTDANYKEVAQQEVTTDAYGMAWADFTLPQDGLTGRYAVRTDKRKTHTFRVEEYKRPTFEITFPEVNHRYQAGDTVVVTGTARTYTGMPVSGAKVAYRVTRKPAMWCWWSMRDGESEVYADTLRTDSEGHFSVEIPLTVGKEEQGIQPRYSSGRFYNFVASAQVTDLTGESHEAEMSIPLGTKATAFSTTMPQQIEKDSLRQFSFAYKNASGSDIAATVRYRFDHGQELTTSTNTDIVPTADFQRLASGKHTLTAICEQDTLRHEFYLFTMQDTRPATQVDEWFYQTAQEFPHDGGEIHLQMGSSDHDVHMVYALYIDNKVLEQGATDLSDSIITRSFRYQEAYGNGLAMSVAWVKDGKLHTHWYGMRRPMPDKRLQMEWTTFRDRLTPGQKEEWTLRVTHPDGTPAKAQLMSVLYDKSLDQLYDHKWNLNLYLNVPLPAAVWSSNIDNTGWWSMYREMNYKRFDVRELQWDCLSDRIFPVYYIRNLIQVRGTQMVREESMMLSSRAAGNEAKYQMEAPKMMDMASDAVTEAVAMTEEAGNEDGKTGEAQLRENLQETAFFYPAVQADEDGKVSLRFTLPESVTTWKLMALAHDQEMRYGNMTDEVVARKHVMIQPNMPRFLRESDKGTLVARLTNTSEQELQGTAWIELIDPETMKTLYRQQRKFTLPAGETGSASFDIETKGLPAITICKVSATGTGFSDGEQHYLPILPRKERVITTRPFVLHEQGTQTIDLSTLVPESVDKQEVRYTLEYTPNPAWMMIQALPSVSQPDEDNAVSLATAYYANSIAKHVLGSAPHIKTVLQLWQREQGEETSLQSELRKNPELRQLVLRETPWVMDADKESNQRQQLIQYLDESQVSHRLSTQLSKLAELQLADGSFAWWKGMQGSRYMTTAVATSLARLHKMTGKQQAAQQLLSKAIAYLAKQVHEEVQQLKRSEANGAKDLLPSETAMDYLYIIGIEGTKLTPAQQRDRDYLMSLAVARPSVFTIYGKARYAVVLALQGQTAKAREYLQSLKEYTVYREDLGRYFDTQKAYYNWRDYRIPTEVAAIEAIQLLAPDDQQTVREMRQWLLSSKQTQAWDTPINTVDAVYAFLQGNMGALDNTDQQRDVITIDGQRVDWPKATAALGYAKMSLDKQPSKLTIEHTANETSWGTLYADFTQPGTEVSAQAAGISVKREVIGTSHRVGDRVKVRITITADRDYDFVAVVDKRAACLEPANQLSGYQRGYYVSARDQATYYYFDRMAKGQHVIETEYYIDRQGSYQQGTCYAECAYSPAFRGVVPGQTILIK